MTTAARTRATANAPGGRDVREFGATGDGTTDDTAGLQAALDSGDALYLPPGVYLTSATLYYGTGLHLAGDPGHTAVLRNTTTRTEPTMILAPAGLGVTGVLIQDIGLDQRGDVYDASGDDAHDPLMSVNATVDARLHRVLYRNARTMAVWADAVPGDPTTGLQIVGCEIQSAGGGGFSLFGELTGFEITGNTIRGTQDDAIAVQSTDANHGNGLSSSGVIARNFIRACDTQTTYDSTPHGIMVFGAADVTVDSNDIDSTYSSGIQVCFGGDRRATNVDVTNNRVRAAGVNNTLGVTPAYGLFLLDADYVTFAGNDVASCLHGNYFESGCTNILKDF